MFSCSCYLNRSMQENNPYSHWNIIFKERSIYEGFSKTSFAVYTATHINGFSSVKVGTLLEFWTNLFLNKISQKNPTRPYVIDIQCWFGETLKLSWCASCFLPLSLQVTVSLELLLGEDMTRSPRQDVECDCQNIPFLDHGIYKGQLQTK